MYLGEQKEFYFQEYKESYKMIFRKMGEPKFTTI